MDNVGSNKGLKIIHSVVSWKLQLKKRENVWILNYLLQ